MSCFPSLLFHGDIVDQCWIQKFPYFCLQKPTLLENLTTWNSVSLSGINRKRYLLFLSMCQGQGHNIATYDWL